jgi:nitrate reductase NapE component
VRQLTEFPPGRFGIPSPFAGSSPRATARLAGALYLAYIATTALATYLRSTFIAGDAATTARNIVANPSVLRVAFVTDLVSAVLFFLAAWTLYVLLRPVNENYATAFLLLNLGGVVIQSANALNLFAALQVLTDSNFQTAFSPAQVQAMAMNDINLYNHGFMIAQVFFGTWLFPLGYLVYRSRFLPRFIGILLLLDGFAVLFWFSQYFLLPSYSVISYPALAVSFVAEFGLALWLVVRAVADPGQLSSDEAGRRPTT